jgi:ComF family protein
MQKGYVSKCLNVISGVLMGAIDHILPYRCIVCYDLLQDNQSFCAPCWSKLNFINAPFCNICGTPFPFKISDQDDLTCAPCLGTSNRDLHSSRSLLLFDENSKHLIHKFKYYDYTHYSKTFARLLCTRYADYIADIDYIIPVPMYWLKRIYRQYNQSLVLANSIAKLSGKQVLPDVLIKTRYTASQTYLSKKMRDKNITGSIIFNQKYLDHVDKTFLLIDDVHTTGATRGYCSKILALNGVKKIKCLTIART